MFHHFNSSQPHFLFIPSHGKRLSSSETIFNHSLDGKKEKDENFILNIVTTKEIYEETTCYLIILTQMVTLALKSGPTNAKMDEKLFSTINAKALVLNLTFLMSYTQSVIMNLH
jgi:hypothetical protein